MFHRSRKVKIASVIQAGLTRGITMRQKMVNSPAPSMRAASSISSGIVVMNCRIRKTPKLPARTGSSRDQ